MREIKCYSAASGRHKTYCRVGDVAVLHPMPFSQFECVHPAHAEARRRVRALPLRDRR